jgi:CheY-like chemotaxis protein
MMLALLVDDNRPLLESVAAAAAAATLELVTADSWEDGLALFHVLSPELVVADYNMPGSRMGLQLLAEIRRLRPSVRLVLVSGYLDAEDIAQVDQLGLVDATLTKGNSVETAQAIMAELQAVADSTAGPTDWVDFADAYVTATSVPAGGIDRLDALFAAKLEGHTDADVPATVTTPTVEPTLGYFDTSALMRWVEADVSSPDERTERVGKAVQALLDGEAVLAVSELTLIEFRTSVADDLRRTEAEKAECDQEWTQRAKIALMRHIADRRLGIVPVPDRAYEHAMVLVDMAASEHQIQLRTWDAVHLITACSWAYSRRSRVRLFTTNGHFEKFTAAYPHFSRFAEIVHLDLATRTATDSS